MSKNMQKKSWRENMQPVTVDEITTKELLLFNEVVNDRINVSIENGMISVKDLWEGKEFYGSNFVEAFTSYYNFFMGYDE